MIEPVAQLSFYRPFLTLVFKGHYKCTFYRHRF